MTPLNSSFLQNKKALLKRNYEDIVSELVTRAKEAFDDQTRKVKVAKGSKSKNKEESLHSDPSPLPKMSYKKYTRNQKEAILNLVPYISNVQIEQQFGVDETTVRYWVKYGIKEDQRKNNGKVADFEEIEQELAQILLSIREKGQAVTSSVIYKEIKNLIISHYKINEEEYKLLQNYASYCSKKSLKNNIILTTKSNEEVYSYDNKKEEVKLSKDQFMMLRDAFIS